MGLEALPLQARAPVLEEAPRPALALVVPELTEGLLEQVGRVQLRISLMWNTRNGDREHVGLGLGA